MTNKVSLNIQPLIGVVKLRHRRTQMHLEQLQGKEHELHIALKQLNYDLQQKKKKMSAYKKTAYMEKLRSKVCTEDIEIIRHKLQSMDKMIESVISNQKDISMQIDDLRTQITGVKKQLRFFSVKEEKYLHLLDN